MPPRFRNTSIEEYRRYKAIISERTRYVTDEAALRFFTQLQTKTAEHFGHEV